MIKRRKKTKENKKKRESCTYVWEELTRQIKIRDEATEKIATLTRLYNDLVCEP